MTHTHALFAAQSQSILDDLVCYWARTVGSRFRVWQGLDCRPQLIDQHAAVVHFPLPLDAGQSIPRTIGRLPLSRAGANALSRCILFAAQSQSILDNLVCYWATTVGSRFRVWQGLDCRPQLIDQHSAVVHFPLPLDAGQTIPRTIGRLPLSRAGANALSRCILGLQIAHCGVRRQQG